MDGAVVEGALIETRKGDKIKVFKKIRRQGYRRTQGHRQLETVVRITGLKADGKSETWDGAIDLTTRAELNARARGLKLAVAAAPAVEAPVEAAPAVEAEAPAKPKRAAKPKAPKAEAPAADAGDEA